MTLRSCYFGIVTQNSQNSNKYTYGLSIGVNRLHALAQLIGTQDLTHLLARALSVKISGRHCMRWNGVF